MAKKFTITELYTLMEKVDSKVGVMGDGFSLLADKVGTLTDKVEAQNEKLDQIETKLEPIEFAVKNHSLRLTKLEEHLPS